MKNNQNIIKNNIWVVTVNWNRAYLTKKCITSLREKNDLIFKVVIVDNGSDKESIDYIRNIPSVVILENENNLGFSRGFNKGIKYALSQGADYILIINNDTESDYGMFDVLYSQSLLINSRLSAPAIFYMNYPNQIWSLGGDFCPLFLAPINAHNRNQTLPNKPIQREFLTGCALLIHHDLFEKIGFFDENLFLYYEDLDFSLRAKKANQISWLIPQAKLFHHVEGSIPKPKSDDHYYWMAYSSCYYFLKHIRPWQCFFVIPWRVAHIIKQFVFFMFSGKIRAVNAYFQGLKKFLFENVIKNE